MIYFFPIGVEEASVNRVPAVSLGIAATCALAFMVTWVVPSNPAGARDTTMREIFAYWEDHPYLEASDGFKRDILSDRGEAAMKRLREEAMQSRTMPPAEQVRVEQARFRVMTDQAVEELNQSPMRRWSLVPARGAGQVGWLTHMFLHFGWMHILFNLFFFYLVGPLLEDVWGRIYFLGFYVLGGLFAGFSHFLLDTHSSSMMAGASGAIAACMGAFTFRYATRKVRMAYFVWIVRIWRGVFGLPAWLWGAFWFGGEVLNFLGDDGSSGVAVMAHMGGFGFGFVLALAMKLTGFETRFLAPSVEQSHTWQQHPALQTGLEAFERGELDPARAAFEQVLQKEPDNADAQFALARVEIAQGGPGHARLERVFSRLAVKGQAEEIARMVREAGPALQAAQLTPSTAYKIGSALDEMNENGHLSEPFYARAGMAAGLLGAKAMIRAAELGMTLGLDPKQVLSRVDQVRKTGELPEALSAKAILLEESARRAIAAAELAAADSPKIESSGLELATPGDSGAFSSASFDIGEAEPEPVRGPPRVMTCQLESFFEDGLTVVASGGKQRTLAFNEVLAVGVGAVPMRGADGSVRNTLLTDLVVSWGGGANGPTVLRLTSGALGLGKLYPGVPPLQAYRQLLGALLESSGAKTLADRDALLRGEFPKFTAVDDLERACYGAGASA